MKVFVVLVTLLTTALCKECYYCTDFAADVDLPDAARESIAGSMVPCERNTTCTTEDAQCVSISYSIDLILEPAQAKAYQYSVNMYFCGGSDVGQSLCDNYQSMYQGSSSQSNGMTLVDCTHSSGEGALSNSPFSEAAVITLNDDAASSAVTVLSTLFGLVAIALLL